MFCVSKPILGSGYGRTRPLHLPTASDKVRFMQNLLYALQLDAPVLVSPSVSGTYSLPMVMEQPQLLAGFIAISPTADKIYNATHMQQNQVGIRGF